jgi:type III secretion protein U
MQPDKDRRTEPPSAHKLRRARQRGELAMSRQVCSTAALLGAAAGLVLVLPRGLAGLAGFARGCFAAGDAGWAQRIPGLLLEWLAPVGLAAAAAALLAGGLQSGLRLRLRWRPSALDPLRGMRRLFSGRRLTDLGWAAARLAVLAGIGAVCLIHWLPELLAAVADLDATAGATRGLLLRLGAALAAGAVGLAAIDRWLVRRRFLRDQRMTPEEVRRERKEQQGDPAVRSERKRRHRRLLEGGGLAAVAEARVVVVNPTHAAAALRYQHGRDPAPVVLTAGRGALALAIRRRAERLGVPVIEHVPLARALAGMESGQTIPEDLYAAAAEVIGTLERLA